MMLLDPFILAVAFLATRLPFLLARRDADETSDREVYLWLTDILARGKVGMIDKKLKGAFLADRVLFPLFPHWFFAKLPGNKRLPVMLWVNIFVDALLIMSFLWALVVGEFLNWEGGWLIPVVLYSASPLLHPPGARLNSVGGRIYATLLFFIYMLMAYKSHEGWMFVVVAVVTALVTLNISIFGAQALLFFSVPLAIWRGDHWIFTPLLIGFLVSLLLPIGTWNLWKGRVYHYMWYLRFMQRMNRISLRRHWYDLKTFDLMRVASGLLVSNPVSAILLSCPFLLILFVTPPEISEALQFCREIGFVSLALALLCSFYPGAVWGESERYVEMALAFIIYYFLGTEYHNTLLVPMLIWSFSVVLFNSLVYENKDFTSFKESYGKSRLSNLANFIRQSGARRVLTFPMKLSYRLGRECPESNFPVFNYNNPGGYDYYFGLLTKGVIYQFQDAPAKLKEIEFDLMVGTTKEVKRLSHVMADSEIVYDDGSYVAWKWKGVP